MRGLFFSKNPEGAYFFWREMPGEWTRKLAGSPYPAPTSASAPSAPLYPVPRADWTKGSSAGGGGGTQPRPCTPPLADGPSVLPALDMASLGLAAPGAFPQLLAMQPRVVNFVPQQAVLDVPPGRAFSRDKGEMAQKKTPEIQVSHHPCPEHM